MYEHEEVHELGREKNKERDKDSNKKRVGHKGTVLTCCEADRYKSTLFNPTNRGQCSGNKLELFLEI